MDAPDTRQLEWLKARIPAELGHLKRWALDLTKEDDFLSDDLVQDTVVRAMERWDKFRGGNLRAWLFRLLHNIHVDYRRKEELTLKRDEDNPGRPNDPDIDLPPTAGLSRGQREVMELRAMGLDGDQIAEVLDITKEAVYSKIRHAKIKLRRFDANQG
jgi:DNA-directed RNA polymerase specialized sigma24 family protein